MDDDFEALVDSGSWNWTGSKINDDGTFNFTFSVEFGNTMLAGAVITTDGKSVLEYDIYPSPNGNNTKEIDISSSSYDEVSKMITEKITIDSGGQMDISADIVSNKEAFKAAVTNLLLDKQLITKEEAADYVILSATQSGFYTKAEKLRTAEQRLIKAGDWHIDEEDFIRYQHAKTPDEVGYLGTVEFGHTSFDFIGSGDEAEPFNLNVEEYLPNVSNSGIFEFSKDLSEHLSEPYYVGNIETLERDISNMGSIDDFKLAVVRKLLQEKLLNRDEIEMYQATKDSGTSYSTVYNNHTKKLLYELSRKPKLSTEEIKTVSTYYFSDKNDASLRDAVKDIVLDGFSDLRVKTFAMAHDDVNADAKIYQKVSNMLVEPFFKEIKESVKNHRKNEIRQR